MAARSIIVPRFTIDDFEGDQFASRVAHAEAALAERGYTAVTVTQIFDVENKLVACTVTGQLSVDGNQKSN